MEEKGVAATLSKGATCCTWNFNGQRLISGSIDGSLSVYDSPSSSLPLSLSLSSHWRAHESGVAKLVWAPPEYGDAVACICSDGSVSLWEELHDDSQSLIWKLCHLFEGAATARAVNLQFGLSSTALKMAEFQNVIDSVSRFGNPTCLSASSAWNPRRGDDQQFVLGFNSDSPQFNSAKIWEFEEDHQRWVPVAELALPEDKGERVHAVAWAPNIGRPYEIIAVATCKGIAIWHVEQQAGQDGRLSTKKVVLLSGHDGEIWQVEWDMSGMTLASTRADGMVRLWQCNLNGIWQEQAALDCCHAQN
ncbi:hypothetical protein QJS10_CPB20g02051 [Acorus calamus]|uniref:Protein SEH1 n=1 Tax=Acorus calamus TaxID=4465 RepID=A0AAV9CBU6_ACOCL|nr:hypothetical protein QJS10_CPB20g02051 [Acorus calamus]